MKDALGNVRTLQSPRESDLQAKSQNRAILTVSHERAPRGQPNRDSLYVVPNPRIAMSRDAACS